MAGDGEGEGEEAEGLEGLSKKEPTDNSVVIWGGEE